MLPMMFIHFFNGGKSREKGKVCVSASHRAPRRVLKLLREFPNQRLRPPDSVQLRSVEEAPTALGGCVLKHLFRHKEKSKNKDTQAKRKKVPLLEIDVGSQNLERKKEILQNEVPEQNTKRSSLFTQATYGYLQDLSWKFLASIKSPMTRKNKISIDVKKQKNPYLGKFFVF